MQTSLVKPAYTPKNDENRRFFRLLVSTLAVILLHFFVTQWLRQPFTEIKPAKPQPIEVTLLPPPVKEKEPEPKPVIKPEPIVKPKPIVKAKPLPPKPEVKPKIEPKAPPKPQVKATPKPVVEKPAPVAKPTAPKPAPISPPVLATTRPSPSPALSVQAPTPIAAPGPVSAPAKSTVAAPSASAKPAPKPVEDTGGEGGDGGNAPPHCQIKPPKREDYPRAAISRHIEGSVKLKVKIGPGGVIEQVTVDTSSGHEMLDNAAIQTVKSWNCSPAKRNGKAVVGEVRVPIKFNLQN